VAPSAQTGDPPRSRENQAQPVEVMAENNAKPNFQFICMLWPLKPAFCAEIWA
jgi:hypothetical protein